MGNTRWSASDWKATKSTYSTKTREQIFKSRTMKGEYDPKTITVRESVDSDNNPNSTPIILATDVTGSMGVLAEQLIKKNLGVVMQEIYDRQPISDPHIMYSAIGDVECDQAPLQCTQFEADVSLTKQLEETYIEGGGGGNGGESYNLVWYFAATKVKADSFSKRNKKGYIFTIGDECTLGGLTDDQIKKVFGDSQQRDLNNEELLEMVHQNWNVYHLIVKPVAYQNVSESWESLLGQNAINVQDQDKIAEIIVSCIQINEGAKTEDVIDSWSGDTSLVVREAVSGLTTTEGSGSDDIVAL